jgi:hypothetical protein
VYIGQSFSYWPLLAAVDRVAGVEATFPGLEFDMRLEFCDDL